LVRKNRNSKIKAERLVQTVLHRSSGVVCYSRLPVHHSRHGADAFLSIGDPALVGCPLITIGRHSTCGTPPTRASTRGARERLGSASEVSDVCCGRECGAVFSYSRSYEKRRTGFGTLGGEKKKKKKSCGLAKFYHRCGWNQVNRFELERVVWRGRYMAMPAMGPRRLWQRRD